jgi:predicted metal-dependent enzyme (double-stranded beta helix superfamily)
MSIQMPDSGAVAAVARAIERAMADDPIAGTGAALALLQADGALSDDALFAPLDAEHYSRKLIWLDAKERFVIVGMTWGPGHLAPLHDHQGLWGADVVVAGAMREILYRLEEHTADGRYRFSREHDRIAHRTEVGYLRPPLEYHEFGNAGDGVARTVHVYGGNLVRGRWYERDGDWWSANDITYSYG